MTVLEQIRRVLDSRVSIPLEPLPRRILLGELDFAELTAAVRIADGPSPSVFTIPILVLPIPRVPPGMMFDRGQIPMPGDAPTILPLSADHDDPLSPKDEGG